ncbi:diguanylate cyclase [Pseudidiomarina sp. 1APP75-32.1]|uniref:Diguanylate cyclase n=1 Tax=Pseudidiomarina terrestris TaxID=2820060 RepID=A0AAW7R1T8_9GAMM|nr:MULTISPECIES: sensor domain-containing diguanylate cyclase [unclassified Pseudidiomarina]MDN7124922.1 diguanylate cyclase [Pseudidiomarina sp. 1APP75-32.1]MDN7129605.1 diguanylate cyclase [Pseudidiomarina sp. 1APR75-15]
MDANSLLEKMPGVTYQLMRDPAGQCHFAYISPWVESLLGFSHQQLLQDASDLLSAIHPDDYRDVTEAGISSAERGIDWHYHFRLLRPGNNELWLNAFNHGEQLADGTLVWTGYLVEDTERHRLENELIASEQRFRTLVEQANDIIFTVDANGILGYLSPNWQDKLGYAIDESINQSFEEIVHGDDIPACNAYIQAVISGAEEVKDIEFRVRHANGAWRWYTCRASRIQDNSCQQPHLLGIAREITEQRRQREKIARMARQDMLTNLPNRAYFYELFERSLALSSQQNRSLAVLFVDLDYFKPVNDTYGHSVGDQLLIHVARRIKSCLRDTDVACRTGGDEFLVLANDLPTVEIAHQVATSIAERIREELAKPFAIEKLKLQITASLGIAIYPAHAEQSGDILRCADRAMYQAKTEGRDRVRIAECEDGKASEN